MLLLGIYPEKNMIQNDTCNPMFTVAQFIIGTIWNVVHWQRNGRRMDKADMVHTYNGMSFSGKESICQCNRLKRHRFDPWARKIPWRRQWQPTPVFLTTEFQGQRSLVGYSLWGHKELDTTEQLTWSQCPWLGEAAPQPECCSVCAQKAPARTGLPWSCPPA